MAGVLTTKTNTRTLVPVVRERLADLETPVSAFAKLRALGGAFLLDTVVCFDHVRHSLVVLAHDVAGERESAQDRIARVFSALDAPLVLPETAERSVRSITANGTPDEFRTRVARARELIAEGDCIQIVVSQRFDVRPAPEPLALYRALRHINPSPYMFLIGAGG